MLLAMAYRNNFSIVSAFCQMAHKNTKKKKGSSFDEPNSVTHSNDGGTHPSHLVSHQLNSILDGINAKNHSPR